ncbi:hypothetical protein ERX35_001005 [Macrococcus equipercicus]|uniref:Uncharacterized protein n=1 Tax=Macrococcus equipercicus TaxID=69967 RepID=A0ABQ6RBD4_9STAP|nr:hypothetical protein [Macrococcus equipercicus]KAA1042491.1 hypothetical protein ERX35_001005 [Macrococcus equipercicus]
MTVTYHHWELNGQETYGRIDLTEMNGQRYVVVSRKQLIEILEKLVRNHTDIKSFCGITDDGNRIDLLKEYYDNKTIYFCNYEKINEFEAIAEIKYSDLNPHQNFTK